MGGLSVCSKSYIYSLVQQHGKYLSDISYVTLSFEYVFFNIIFIILLTLFCAGRTVKLSGDESESK